MPIYEFRCSDCKKRFEKLCVMGETGASLICPSCGATKPARIMSSFKPVGIVERGFENNFEENDSFNNSSCSSCSASSCSSCGY